MTFPPQGSSVDASQVVSGRLATTRLPDGPAGQALIGQGAGLTPVFASIGSLGASCWVVAYNAKASIKDFARILRSNGYPVWVCSGTNDNVQIQAAMDFLLLTGGEVLLSDGTFVLGTPICPPNNCTVRGSGRSTVLRDYGIYLQYNYPVGTRSNIALQDLTIDLNNVGAYGVFARNASRFKIHDLEIKNPTNYCIFCYSMPGDALQVSDFEVYNNYLHTAVDNGIYVTGTGPCVRFIIKNNIVDRCCSGNTLGRSSIEVDYSTEGIIDGNVITNHLGHNTASASVRVYGIPEGGVSITNNKSANSLDLSYYVNSCDGVIVSNNSSRSAAWLGYCSEVSKNTVIDGNFSHGDMAGGIATLQFAPNSDVGPKVVNNTVINSGSWGIYCDSAYGTVEGNYVKNSGYGSGGTAYDGIKAITADYMIIRGNTCLDDQGVKTQGYGISLQDAVLGDLNNSIVVDNVVVGNALGGIEPGSGTDNKISGNQGHTDEKLGVVVSQKVQHSTSGPWVSRIVGSKACPADNTLTSVVTVTVPNNYVEGQIRLDYVINNNGNASRTYAGGRLITFGRRPDGATVKADFEYVAEQSVLAGGAETIAISWSLSANVGLDTAVQTFDIEVTCDSSDDSFSYVHFVATLIGSNYSDGIPGIEPTIAEA